MLDVVVMGGGLAGLSCAARAAEIGLTVQVFEQGREEHYPCNSRYSGGMFHLDYHDIGAPTEQLVASLLARCPPDIDKSVIEVIARRAAGAVRWLQAHARTHLVRVGPAPYEKWVLAPPRPPKPGLVHPGRGPDVLLGNLADYLAAHGQPICRNVAVVDVARAANHYLVTTCSNDVVTTTAARTVVFADGGFQADSDKVQRSITPDFAKVLQRNAGSGKGVAMDIAAALGAVLSELCSFYGHLVSRQALNSTELWPYPMIDSLAKAGVLVGPDGRRFADEGRTGVHLANQVARRADATDAVVIVDDRTWWTVGRDTRVPPNPVLTNRGGTLWSATSLAGLASKAGLRPDGLCDTVAAHNAYLDDMSSELQPARKRTANALPIATPPFHAIPVCAGITYTMGGIVVNERAEVQAAIGGVLPGLYAAGAAVGGVEGGESSFYVGGLCKALVLGLVSAEQAAAYIKDQSSHQRRQA